MIIIKGDVNLDGKIDADDLMLLYLVLDNNAPDVFLQAGSPAFLAADIDGDGVLTTSDYAAIMAHIQGEEMITEVLEIDGI